MRERKLLNGEGSKEEGEGKYPISRYPMGPTKNSFLGIAQIVAGGISQPKLFWTHYFNSINGKTFNNQKRYLGLQIQLDFVECVTLCRFFHGLKLQRVQHYVISDRFLLLTFPLPIITQKLQGRLRFQACAVLLIGIMREGVEKSGKFLESFLNH